ncbi:MAG: protein translocase subunit SecD [candidate division Zixibacteria bacterium]|nr:protein translocase subunit SecD [candidate division Zixibacteria bacterium]
MSRTQTWRISITLLMVLVAIYFSWPTVKYWSMPQAEKDQLGASNPAQLFAMKSEAIRLGRDLQGGMYVVLRVQMEQLDEKSRKGAVDRALQIIRNRIDQFGVTEPTIQTQGDDRIVVELPGFTDTDRAQKLIGETAQLQFKLLETNENANLLLGKIDKLMTQMGMTVESVTPTIRDTSSTATPDTSSVDVLADLMGTKADSLADTSLAASEEREMPFSMYLENVGNNAPEWMIENEVVPNMKAILNMPEFKRLLPPDVEFAWGTRSEIDKGRMMTSLYLLKSRVQMSGEYLTDANPQTDQFGKPTVSFQLTNEGGRIFARVTGPNIGKPLAIVLDGRVESAPNIQDRIRDRGQITMGSGATFTEAKDLSIVLKAGALPAPVEIIESNVVGPSMGADSIRKGLTSSLVALLLVIIFIGIYYRLSGVIADVALIFNLFFLLACMAAMRATLTMPGIAGIILTMGISVDSNVLIFERIREEMATGKTIRASIDAGYDRALLTIIDSHVTTLITAAILFIFGSGPVKGFAVSLFLGVLISLYTALVITKAIFDIRKGYKTLSI